MRSSHLLRLLLTAATLTLVVVLRLRAQNPPDATHRAGIAGSVLDSLGHPISFARVIVDGSKSFATTDDSGHFDLRGLPAGRNGFTITKLGYAPVSFEAPLPPDSVIVVAIRMRAVQVMTSVVTTALRTNQFLMQIGFEDRRRSGFGDFLTPARVDSLVPQVTTVAQLLSNIPGITVQCAVACTVRRTLQPSCLTLFVDGNFHGFEQIDNLGLPPDAVAAIEVYKLTSTVPSQFQRGNCGALVVWTKARVP